MLFGPQRVSTTDKKEVVQLRINRREEYGGYRFLGLSRESHNPYDRVT